MEPGSSRAGKSTEREDHKDDDINLDISLGSSARDVISDAHQVFDEMSQREEDDVLLTLTAGGTELKIPTFSSSGSCITDLGKSISSTLGGGGDGGGGGDVGVKKCAVLGCTKSARGRTLFCVRHGGGVRCKFDYCGKSAQGDTGFCKAHGGRKNCAFKECTKSARGSSGFCLVHGGGGRCQYPGCPKGAKSRTPFCKSHAHGRRWCTWESGDEKCRNLTRASTGLCDVHSKVETTKTRAESSAVSGLDTSGLDWNDMTDQSCIGSSGAHHGIDDTARRWILELSGFADDSDNELMFYTVLTPSDVGESEHLAIPKEHAQKHFPHLYSAQEKEGLLLPFEDSTGKVWLFRYSCLSGSHSYTLSKGWSCFVKQYQLAPSDVVFFLRGVSEEGKEKLFIQWSRGVGAAPAPSRPLSLHSLPKPAFHFDRIVADKALLFCGLFPPGYEFERETMVQLWMADGIFVEEPMDWIADLFFEDCVTKGYIRVSRTNSMTGNVMYKLESKSYLAPLLTLSLDSSGSSHVSRIESDSNLKDCPPDVFHLSVSFSSSVDFTVLGEFGKFKQLRTLLFLQSHELSFKQVPHDFFQSLKVLRTLDLSRTHLTELPDSIRNMTCLRYLNLSENPIQRLPEVIDCLENLQTLKLRGCSDLSTLPNGMSKLVSLRHLDFDVLQQLYSMPSGMGALANIRTLSAFLIGEDEGCSIRQLKNMNNLSGSFCISGLENVLTEEEALEASLLSKVELSKLDLRWGDLPDEGDIEDHEKVLTSLQPNACLQELEISCYGGFELPKWVSDTGFSRLTSITLFKFENCLVLPSLGQLSSLKILNIIDFGQLKMIDYNFYGGRDTQGYIAFPKLEKLTVQNLSSLEEWSGIGKSDFPCLSKLVVKHCSKLYSLCTVSYLCALKDLEISNCSALASCADDEVPASVETFVIENCPLLSERFLKNGGQELLKLVHVPNLWIDHQQRPFGRRSTQGHEDSLI